MYLLTMELDWNKILEFGKEIAFTYGPNFVLFFVILIFGRIAAKTIKRTSVKLMKKGDTDASIQSFVASLVYVASMVFVVIAALNVLGIPTASFVAVVGAAGLAIGLAFQGALSNFAAGFLIIVFKPYKVGDFIKGGSELGSVKEIQLFTTTLTTPDNKTIIVPNSQMTESSITNYSTEEKRRVDLVIGVGYDDDLDKVKDILSEILKNCDLVLKEPEPTIGIIELADSSVNFTVRSWVEKANYWNVHFYLHETIKKEFDKNNISIPFPQRDVHIYEKKKL